MQWHALAIWEQMLKRRSAPILSWPPMRKHCAAIRISDLGIGIYEKKCPHFVLATHVEALRSNTHKQSGHRHS